MNKYIAHHGIEGQKWGQTNGPPYPLDYNDHSALEIRSNPKSELDNYLRETADKAKNYVRKHKVGLTLGGIAITAILMHKAEKHLRKEYIKDITPYWKDQMSEINAGQKYLKRMEKDLNKMSFSDLASEARFVKRNDWSRLFFDGKHWR